MSLATATVDELLPGSPLVLESLSAGLSGFARIAEASLHRLHSIDTGAWVGDAAEAFREVVGDVPAKLGDAAFAFHQAAETVAAYNEVLRASQREVAEALELYRLGIAQTDGWQDEWDRWRRSADAAQMAGEPVPSAPSSTDPGAWERSEAERRIGRAQADFDDAARLAADGLQAAGSLAPDQPGFWSRLRHQVGQFGAGVWDSVWGMGEFVWSISTVRMLTDPEGWLDDVSAIGEGIVYGVRHPVEFARAAVNWDMWLDNPARALGQLVPDVALALATAGGGAAAAGARRSADALDTASDLGRIANRLDEGLSVRGLRPAPGTRIRPEGLPDGWRIRGTTSAGGVQYIDPGNRGNWVRIMQGNTNSPYPHSQAPYVRWQRNGRALDVNGNPLPSAKIAEAHIPLADFRFQPEVFD